MSTLFHGFPVYDLSAEWQAGGLTCAMWARRGKPSSFSGFLFGGPEKLVFFFFFVVGFLGFSQVFQNFLVGLPLKCLFHSFLLGSYISIESKVTFDHFTHTYEK